MKKCLLIALLVFIFAGCATHQVPKQELPSGNRVIWVKDFEPVTSIKISQAQKVCVSDKIALILDSRFSHKFSAIYRYPPPSPGTSIVVTGTIIDFGPGSTPDADQGSISTWMQQFGAGRLAMEVTVTDAATGEKLINKAEIVYPIFEDIDFFGWTRLEQTINIAVENITRKIGKLKIKNL
jgi:hypothetical protein